VIVPNISVCISGPPKTGKTFLALTFPAPIVLYSFEGGAEYVARTRFSKKDITIRNYQIPVQFSTGNGPVWAQAMWQDIHKQYEADISGKKYATAILDTGTHLWEIIRGAFEEKLGHDIGKARNYGEPNSNMAWMLRYPITVGMNLVAIQYLKDVYVNDQLTGEQDIDGFKRTKGLADIALITTRKGKDIVTRITDCRFALDLCDTEHKNLTHEQLMLLLGIQMPKKEDK